MPLDRAWIESRIPHRGRMCLLDYVVAWTPERIVCSSGGHRDPHHPLRAHGRLGIACGIELASQAMALHGAILSEGTAGTPRAGLLAGVRGVRMRVARLDDVQSELICDALRIAGDRSTALYEFELRAAGRELLSGRATVVFDADERIER